MACFVINRHEEGLRGRFKKLKVKDWRERREKKKEEEKKEAKLLPNHDCNRFLHHSSFGVLRSSFG